MRDRCSGGGAERRGLHGVRAPSAPTSLLARGDTRPSRDGERKRAQREPALTAGLLARRTSTAPHTAAGPAVNELFARLREENDTVARETLASMFMPLARRLAQRYVRSSEPREDLVQVASLGLVKAIDRFDPSRGHTFASYAIPTILGELRRYFRDSTWSVHVPRGAQERAAAIETAQEALRGEHRGAPTVAQIADYLEVSSEEVLDGMLAVRAYEADSLDAPAVPGEDGEGRSGLDRIGSEDARYELIEADVSAAPVIRELPERERRVLHLRFVQEMSQSEIAAQIGVSQMQVSRILARCLAQIREQADAPAG